MSYDRAIFIKIKEVLWRYLEGNLERKESILGNSILIFFAEGLEIVFIYSFYNAIMAQKDLLEIF